MSAAQEEFKELMRDKSHRTAHRDDDNDEDDDEFHTSRPSSRHRSRDPGQDDDEDFDDGDDTAPPISRPGLSSNHSTIPSIRFQANTGPKGVITDAQDFLDSRRVHRRQSAMRLGAGNGQGSRAPSQPQQLPQQNGAKQVGKGIRDGDEGDDDDDDDEEEDDDFMLEWRRSRLRELQNGVRENMVRVSPSPGRRTGAYGGLVTVDGEGYLDAVDNSAPDTVVLVYIYDDFSDVSDMLEDRCIRPLATKHPDARFVKMHYEDAAMEPAGVPALLAYRGGEKFAALVPLIDDFPDDADLSAATLEAILKRHQVLK